MINADTQLQITKIIWLGNQLGRSSTPHFLWIKVEGDSASTQQSLLASQTKSNKGFFASNIINLCIHIASFFLLHWKNLFWSAEIFQGNVYKAMFMCPTFDSGYLHHSFIFNIFYEMCFNWCENVHTQINRNALKWLIDKWHNAVWNFFGKWTKSKQMISVCRHVATIYCNNVSKYENHNLSRITLALNHLSF